MSHTRSSAKAAAAHGSFFFECRSYDGEVFRYQDGFATAAEADRAAERAERDMMTVEALGPDYFDLSKPSTYPAISDDELLAELGV